MRIFDLGKQHRCFLRFCGSFLIFSSLFLASCSMLSPGMGVQVDLEAPVLTVTSPENISYTHKEITFRGTCTDNVKVEQITITNEITNTVVGYATINGNEWYFTHTFEEGELRVRIQATDAFHNSSSLSTEVLTLLVDETHPEGKMWYLETSNGIQVPFYSSKEALEEYTNTITTANCYVPQNQQLKIYGQVTDAFSVAEVSIILKEDEVEFLRKTYEPGAGETSYTPKFSFSADFLKGKKDSLKSGKHFIHAYMESKDNSSPQNKGVNEIGWFLWHPESDLPGFSQGQTSYNSSNSQYELTVNINSTIPFEFFDDDGIDEAYINISNSDMYNLNELTGNSSKRSSFIAADSSTSKTVFKNADVGSKSNLFTTFASPEITGNYYIYALAKDKNEKWNAMKIYTSVVDKSVPILIIEKPTENTIPVNKTGGNGKTFTISGYSLDTTGCASLKVAFIPGNVGTNAQEKQEVAESIIKNGLTTQSQALGCRSWTATLNSKSASNVLGNYYKQEFTLDINLDDLPSSEQKENKFFVICLENNNHTKVYKAFRINGDKQSPTIEYKGKLSINMASVDYEHEDLVMIFRAYKASNLAMDYSKYKISYNVTGNTELTKNNDKLIQCTSDGTASQTGEYVKAIIGKATLTEWAKNNVQLDFNFTAEDVLGNEVTDKRTVVLGIAPSLNRISTNLSDGTYPFGKDIILQASFTSSVKYTGEPRLVLYKAEDTTKSSPIYANIDSSKSGNGTDTLKFKYTVASDIKTSKLICDCLDLNGGLIFSSSQETNYANISTIPSGSNLQDTKTIAIDSYAPAVKSITLTTGSTASSVSVSISKGKEIEAAVKFTKDVLVNGSPVIKLKNGASAVQFTYYLADGDTVYFKYTVSSSSPQGILLYSASDFISSASLEMISDTIGNKAKSSESPEFTNNITIDTVAPATPSITGLTNGRKYNTAQTITINPNNIESGATVEYSKDGGSLWDSYDSSSKPVISESGSYTITARQIDKAGNVSDKATAVSITISKFPEVIGLQVSNSDGRYNKSSIGGASPLKLNFKLFFDDKINASSATASLIFTDYAGNAASETTVNTKTTEEKDYLEFEYVVKATDNFNGIKVKNISLPQGFTDVNGNAPITGSGGTSELIASFCSEENAGSRSGIIIDTTAPTVSAFTPASSVDKNGAITQSITVFPKFASGVNAGKSYIKVKFSEKVNKEGGYIIVQRKGNWYIPPVLSVSDFNAIFNNTNLTDAQKQKLMLFDNNNGSIVDKKDAWTGMSVGPYRKTTQGLKVSGTGASAVYIPDTQTKYVLDVNLDLDGDTKVTLDPHGVNTKISPNEIRDVLELTDYHRSYIDVTSSSVYKDTTDATGSTYIILIPELENGVEWEIVIPDDSFYDENGNAFAGTKNTKPKTGTNSKTGKIESTVEAATEYYVWSDKVATPVIRVDRYSHGMGAKEPDSTGNLGDEISGFTNNNQTDYVANSGSNVKPSGYARYRIDSITPGATITYNQDNAVSSVVNRETLSNGFMPARKEDKTEQTDHYKTSSIEDVKVSVLDGLTCGTTYTVNTFKVAGDGSIETARKDYIKASATMTGLSSSDAAVEGVFKTVIYGKDWQDGKNSVIIEGGTAKGGEPNVPDFPLRDGQNSFPYARNAYMHSETINGETKTFYTWVTYSIITDWNLLLYIHSHSTNYPKCSYGQMTYLYNYNTY